MKHLTPRKHRGPEVWAKVKAAYLAGEPAPSVCRRFDVGLANLRRRAGAEGWTRIDAALRTDGCEAATISVIDAIDAPTYFVTPDDALERAAQRASWLLAEGRGAEAQALVRAARDLSELVDRNGLARGLSVLQVKARMGRGEGRVASKTR